MMSGVFFVGSELSAADMTGSSSSTLEIRREGDGEISLQPMLEIAHVVGKVMCCGEFAILAVADGWMYVEQ